MKLLANEQQKSFENKGKHSKDEKNTVKLSTLVIK